MKSLERMVTRGDHQVGGLDCTIIHFSIWSLFLSLLFANCFTRNVSMGTCAFIIHDWPSRNSAASLLSHLRSNQTTLPTTGQPSTNTHQTDPRLALAIRSHHRQRLQLSLLKPGNTHPSHHPLSPLTTPLSRPRIQSPTPPSIPANPPLSPPPASHHPNGFPLLAPNPVPPQRVHPHPLDRAPL
jgi:hypothetical protein